MATKVKSLLTPFYKLVHPDVLTKAPENIKSTNTNACTSLNSYLDSISQGQNVPLSSLVFYVPSLKGDDKYHQVKVTLLPFNQNKGVNVRDLHLESTASNILQAIERPQEVKYVDEIDPKTLRKPRVRNEIERDMQQQIRTIFKELERKDRRHRILEEASFSIERQLNKSHPSLLGIDSRRSNRLIRQAVEAATKHTFDKSFEKIGLNLEHLYIDQDLSIEQVRDAFFTLKGEKFEPESFEELKQTHILIGKNECPLIVSTRYSAKNVPGFIQFPFKFVPKELNQFYEQNSQEASRRLNDFERFSDRVHELLRNISREFAPITIGRYMWRNHPDYEEMTYEDAFLGLKNFERIIRQNQLKYTKKKPLVMANAFKERESEIEISSMFRDRDIVEFFTSLLN